MLISGTGDASARLTLADARLAGTCSLPSGVRSRCESPERTRQPKRSSSTKDTEAAQLAVIFANGFAPRLKMLHLDGNQIGDEGCKALAVALGKEGAAPRLEELDLSHNRIGDEGLTALANALGKGAAPRLEKLSLDFNNIGREGLEALAVLLKEGTVPLLKAAN